jgi:hypothetical protein
MGCHTWFYKKVNPQPIYEEVKQYYLKDVDESIKLYQQMIDDTLDANIKEAYPDWTVEMGMKYLPIFERIKRIVEKNLCQVAVCNRYRHNNHLTVYANGNFYEYTHDLTHDVFRIGNYPNDNLFSLEDTLSFIEKNKDKIYHYHFNNVTNQDWKEQLEEFWKE